MLKLTLHISCSLLLVQTLPLHTSLSTPLNLFLTLCILLLPLILTCSLLLLLLACSMNLTLLLAHLSLVQNLFVVDGEEVVGA
jgi:hypothetical protein